MSGGNIEFHDGENLDGSITIVSTNHPLVRTPHDVDEANKLNAPLRASRDDINRAISNNEPYISVIDPRFDAHISEIDGGLVTHGYLQRRNIPALLKFLRATYPGEWEKFLGS